MYVVDTNIINWLADDRLLLSDLPSNGDLIATHVQRDELEKTKDALRRAQLLAKFHRTVDLEVPMGSFVVGISRVGLAKVSDGRLYYSLRDALAAQNKGKLNNSHDAMIVELAIENGWGPLTADRDLAKVDKQNGCDVLHFAP